MLSDSQIATYKTEGLTKSSTCLSEDKIKELNKALEKYLEEHKDENTEFVSGLYERDSDFLKFAMYPDCLLYTSPSPRDLSTSRMPSSA